MSAKTVLKVLPRVTVCLAGVTNPLHSPDLCAQMGCRIRFISDISHRKGTCSLIWGVSHSCVTALWLLFVWGPCFWGWQCCVLAGLLCAQNCSRRTVHFGGVSSEEQRGSSVTPWEGVCFPLWAEALLVSGREGLPGSGASLPISVTICLFAEK